MEPIEKTWDDYLHGRRKSKALDRLILHYVPLVKYVAGRLAVTLPSHVDVNDLVSSGVIGLIEAIKNFQPKFKTKFETYAVIRIRGAMLDELRSLDWVPRSVREKFCTLQRTYANLEQTLGRPARDDEVAAALELSIPELERLLDEERGVSFLSLDEFLSCDDSDKKAMPMVDSVRDDARPSPFEKVELNERKKILAALISELPEQERIVITLYYHEGLMLKEIGRVLNISESRVSQVHTKAVLRLAGKLRKAETLWRLTGRPAR